MHIITPPVAETPLDDMLVEITKAIDALDPELVAHGCLGGEHGYGGRWNSPVFDMRPFYWGDCDCGYEEREDEWSKSHSHADDCYQSDLKREMLAAGGVASEWGWVDRPKHISYDAWDKIKRRIYARLCAKYGKSEFGCAVHCTCPYHPAWEAWVAENGHKPTCSVVLPNFRHHATGMEVRWYKWIGRSMEVVNAPVSLSGIFSDCLSDVARTRDSGSHAKH